MDETSCEFDLVLVDEFDALSIKLKDTVPISCSSKEVPPKYPAKLHAKKVVSELGTSNGIIYLAGEVEKTYEYSDMGPVFRQRRYFFYLTGANFAGCAVTHHIGHSELILWIPTIDPKQILWYGRIPTAADCAASSDIDDVRDIVDLPKYIAKAVKKYTPLYVLDKNEESLPPLPSDSPQVLAGWAHHDTFPSTMWRYMCGISKPAGSQHSCRSGIPYNATLLRPAMDEARVIKTPYEIAAIRKANDISSAAHAMVFNFFAGMETERDAEAMFLQECVRREGKNQAYPVIAGSGVNAATLHYEDNDDTLEGKQMMVLDAGCEWNCYASDITRTLPIGGSWPSQEARDIYALVQEMQNECIRRARPGQVYYELHLVAHQIAALGLLRLGIIKVPRSTTSINEEQLVDVMMMQGVTSAFFPHGLGHHIGLETHDLPGKERLLFLPTSQDGVHSGMKWGKRALVPREVLIGMYKETHTDRSGEISVAKDRFVPFEDDRSSRWKNMAKQAEEVRTMTAFPPPYKGKQALRNGMVVTVEPGIYFCREYIEGYFLSDPNLAAYIDKDVLDRYYPVGGVRIEDDILITEDGHENLTTAPKADLKDN